MQGRLLGFILAAATAAFADDGGVLSGRVTDGTGAALAGAHVEVTSESGKTKTAETNATGEYTLSGLLPGRHVVAITKTQFSPFADGAVVIEAGRTRTLDVTLGVALEEHVVVDAERPGLSIDPDANAGTLTIAGDTLEALPDDPEDLRRVLERLAGPMAGPNGVAFEVDGFSGSVPPRAQIKEIRFNRNPFAAEHDAQMSGGFEITTKAGTGRLAGNLEFGFNDESLNARNAYAPNRPPFQRRSYSADVSGPLVENKLSFNLSVGDNSIEENDIVNATVLDAQLAPAPLATALVAASDAVRVTPRLDWSLGKTHSLMLKYGFDAADRTNAGVGEFSLPSRAHDREHGNQVFQLVESGTLGQVASALRFQYTRRRTRLAGELADPSLEVLEAFNGGGSPVGLSTSLRQTWEIGDVASWAMGASHTVRVGGRVRGSRLDDVSRQNFAGTVTFSGGPAPVLGANDEPLYDASGNIVVETITSLERYRRTLALQQRGLAPDEVRRRGGGASQMRIAGGTPDLGVSQWDVGLFAQDDWRPLHDLQVSLGLRYENQTNISSSLNLAPRLHVSWGPKPKDGKEPPRTVLSAGLGLFYDRVGDDLTLQARRFDGGGQEQYVVAAPEVLDRLRFDADRRVRGVPTVDELSGFEVAQTRRRLSDDLEAPYRIQALVSVEHQLHKGLKLTGILRRNQFYRMLRSEVSSDATGRVYEYQSSGRRRATWYTFGIEAKPNAWITANLNFGGGHVRSDTDDAGTFPANARDLAAEWGAAFWDFRHSGWGMIEARPKGGWRFTVWAHAHTSGAFNITTGRDNNGDGVYSDRPAFATDPDKPGVVATKWGRLDPDPAPGATIIPRNFGRTPGEVNLDISVGKSFRIGTAPAPAPPASGPTANPPAPGKPPVPKGRYTLDVRAYVSNALNHTNDGAPVGNLSSALFGRSTRGNGPRVVNLGIKLSF
jgi:hypothetical protein